MVTHFQDFQNTFESSEDSTNVVNAPREPFVVKQDHESFVDKITCDLNKAPDSPHLHTFSLNQSHCFHCKDVLGDGENSLNDSPSICVNSSQNPPHIDERCYECGDALDGIFCQRCICKSCGKGAHIGHNFPPKVQIISNSEPCNQTLNNEPPQTLPSFDPTCYSEKENLVPCVSKPNFVDESSNVFNLPPQPPIYSCEFYGSNAQYGHYCTPQVPFIYSESSYSQDFNFPQNFHDFQQHMGDEHLDTIPATESDEVIKSRVEDLVPIPSESEGIPDTMCDVHLVNNPTPLEAKDHFEIVINSNDDYSSSDDDSLYYENIEYVEASPPER
nr:hypothetical protein [Tanacetum cinerariifolium]